VIVYVLLNVVTERCLRRWKRRLDETRGSESRLGRALSEWGEELWLPVVLCNCYTAEELSAAERAWQLETCYFDPDVGYNERRGSCASTAKAGRKGGDPIHAAVRASSLLAGLSPEERREYFREADRRGAAKNGNSSVR
jgi:hypothetical protein